MGRNTFSKVSLRLFARLLGTDVGCFLLSFFAFALTQSPTMRAIVQIINIVVIIAVVYPLIFSVGNTDAPMVNSGSRKYQPLKGLWYGVAASSPIMICGIILVGTKIFGFLPNFVNYFKMINSFFFPFCYSIMPTDYTIAELSWSSVLLSLLTLIVIPVVSFFAYQFGLRRFSFGEKVFYKKSKQQEI